MGKYMNRRKFVSLAGLATGVMSLQGCNVNQTLAPTNSDAPRRRARMTVGTQRAPTNDTMLMYFRRHGVEHICGYPNEDGWTEARLRQLREQCESHGIGLDMVQFPFMSSSHVDRSERKAIMLGQEPNRQEEIDQACEIIRQCAAAGIPAIKYNLSLLGVLRTSPTPGRGGTSYSTWRLKDADPNIRTRAGQLSSEEIWEHITHFLEQVVPVAEEFKVRLACHPHDPGVPPEGFHGIARVLGTVEGLKRFVEIKESPHHGLNLCLGTTAEMLQAPTEEIHEVIRYFGSRHKIFNIHFRNIRGRRDDFQEVFPDEGDMDMLRIMMTLKEVDYPYMVMPDHMPRHPDDPNGRQAFAFGYGYIKGLIQAVDALG